MLRSAPDHSKRKRQRGQAAVETAITLPMLLFTALGILQMVMAHQARLIGEYAAYKAARAASVNRLDCKNMRNAALAALLPTIGGHDAGNVGLNQAYRELARKVLVANINEPPTKPGVGMPLVLVDYVVRDFRRPFDRPLGAGATPMTVSVRLSYFYELRIPFAGWIISRFWLSGHDAGFRWAEGQDPIMLTRQAQQPVAVTPADASYVTYVRRGVDNGYFSIPLVLTWTTRMMSDAPPGFSSPDTVVRCPVFP